MGGFREMKLKRYILKETSCGRLMKEDPKGNWVKIEDMMDDLKGLANIMIEFGEEALELIKEEEDDNSN